MPVDFEKEKEKSEMSAGNRGNILRRNQESRNNNLEWPLGNQ